MAALDLTTLHDEALLTTEEVAATFRLSAGRLRNLRCQGLGPRGCKIGRSVKYRLSDVRHWLEAQADPAPSRQGAQ